MLIHTNKSGFFVFFSLKRVVSRRKIHAVGEENIPGKGWWVTNTMGLGVWGFWTLAKPKPLAEQVVFGSLWGQIFSYRNIEWFWTWVIRFHKVGMSLFLCLWSMQIDTCTKSTENTSRGCWENSSTLVYNAFFFSSSPSLFRSASAAVLFYSRLPCLHFHSSGYLFIL